MKISPREGMILCHHRWRDTDGSVTRSMCGRVKRVNNRDDKVYFASMDYMLKRRGGPRPTFDHKRKASCMIYSTTLLQICLRYSHVVFTFLYSRSVIPCHGNVHLLSYAATEMILAQAVGNKQLVSNILLLFAGTERVFVCYMAERYASCYC